MRLLFLSFLRKSFHFFFHRFYAHFLLMLLFLFCGCGSCVLQRFYTIRNKKITSAKEKKTTKYRKKEETEHFYCLFDCISSPSFFGVVVKLWTQKSKCRRKRNKKQKKIIFFKKIYKWRTKTNLYVYIFLARIAIILYSKTKYVIWERK